MIRLENISKTFLATDGTEVGALESVSLHIERGEFVSIVGPSGCGKTTLLEIISGLQSPGTGQVLIQEAPLNGRFGWSGYMSQADTLLPWRTVLENAEIGLEIRGVPKAIRREKVSALIDRVGLRGFENKYLFELSGGMKKRLGLIRILAYDPAVLLLDEPFAALDAQTRETLQEDLLSLWQEYQRTVLFVTHDLVEAITLSDRIVLMTKRPGRVMREYEVPLSRPRKAFEVQFSPQFLSLHKTIRKDLIDEVRDMKGSGHKAQG